MKADYYSVLGISETADVLTIKRGYRAQAIVCHPDRGGSHEAMLRINQAYEILSDPERRRHYDLGRSPQSSAGQKRQAEADATQAWAQAERYPRQWSDFDAWLADDFKQAEYGQWGWFPTVGKSGSGVAFILIGFVIGGIISVSLYYSEPDISIRVIVALPFAGGFISQWLHKQIGKSLHTPAATFSHTAAEPKYANPDENGKGFVYAITAGVGALVVLPFIIRITPSDGYFGDQESVVNWPGVIIGIGICALAAYLFGKTVKAK